MRPTTALSLLHDLLTAAASVSDVIFDVLVAAEFYREGRMGFFYGSVAIFIVAQAAYSFLFAAAYASHRSPGRRLLVFAVCFPIAQAIPLFAWLESLELPCMLRLMRKLGLRPSADNERRKGSADADSLWLAFRAKFASHSGFLAEAVVEAVPQAGLQAAAALLAGSISPLNLISILLSVLVIGSKGWCLSYSLHRPTLAFNSLCVAADVLALFACLTLVFSAPLPSPLGAEDYPATTLALVSALASSARGWLLLLAGLSLCLAVGTGFLLLLATMADDTLLNRRRRLSLDNPFFEVLVVHPASFLLALLPCAVMQLCLKLSYLPVLVFKSLDPEHAMHAAFYRGLYAFASPTSLDAAPATAAVSTARPSAPTCPSDAGVECMAPAELAPAAAPAAVEARAEAKELSDLRVCALNAYLSHARAELPALMDRMELLSSPSPRRHPRSPRRWMQGERGREASGNAWGREVSGDATPDASVRMTSAEKEVQAWARAVGHTGSGGPGTLERRLLELLLQKEEEEEEAPGEEEPAPDADGAAGAAAAGGAAGGAAGAAAALRASMRATVVRHEVGAAASKAEHFLSYRSEALPWLLSLVPCLPGQREPLPDSASLCASGLLDALLQLTAAACLVLAAPALVLWLLSATLLLLLGLLLPLLQPALLLATSQPIPTLAAILSAAYLGCVVGLAALAPAVRRFQSLRADLVSLEGFPKEFYSPAVLAILTTRVETAVRAAHASCRGGAGTPLLRFGDDCTICLKKLLPKQRVTELMCGHSFHQECLAPWLEQNNVCPNCRSPAEPDVAQQLERAAAHARVARGRAAAADGDLEDPYDLR